MRSTILLTVLVGLAAATPIMEKRQDIDFDAYNAIGDSPDVGAPAGNTATVDTYNPTSIISAAVSAATDFDTGSEAVVSKRAPCDPRPPGNFPPVTSPDDSPSSFLAFADFPNYALNAPTPTGYSLVSGFQNLNAAAKDPTYLTYTTNLTTYDPSVCAAWCTAKEQCKSFNIYFERDPKVNPNTAAGCGNPDSITLIKCAFFGAPLSSASATNDGQYQAGFHVVIAGSNSYTRNGAIEINGYGVPIDFGNAIIKAPDGSFTYMGIQTFPQSQPYDARVCAAACDAKTAYDIKHGIPTAANPDICVFFDAFILYKNGANGVFTCMYYTTAYGPDRAINTGQYDNAGNHYTIGESAGYASL